MSARSTVAHTPAPSKRPARALLLEAAARLFYSRGVAATGIDAITAEAGVAKKSLYNNFASCIRADAHRVVQFSAERYARWASGEFDHLT